MDPTSCIRDCYTQLGGGEMEANEELPALAGPHLHQPGSKPGRKNTRPSKINRGEGFSLTPVFFLRNGFRFHGQGFFPTRGCRRGLSQPPAFHP